MNKAELLHILHCLESAQAEFEQLMLDKDWYVTEVTDQILSSIEIITTEVRATYDQDTRST